MANPTMTLIASNTVGSGGASSINFASIPQTYTDLCVKVSARGNQSAVYTTAFMTFNGDTSASYSYLNLQGTGSAVNSGVASSQTYEQIINATGTTATANTFNSTDIYIPNYTGSTYKSASSDDALETNATTAYLTLNAGLFSKTNAITSLTISATSFVQYSTFYLYGIKNS